MQNAAEDVHEEDRREPMPRDPDLPTVSDTTVMFFAAGSLVVTAVALLVLFD
jgi:hypothetical protein